jgi:hypothetical protein
MADHRKLAAVQSAIAETVDAFVGLNLEGHKIAARGTNDDGSFRDLHARFPVNFSRWS